MSPRLLIAIAGATTLAACGGDSKTTTPPPAKKSAAKVPAELAGTYNVKLKPADLPSGKDAPLELSPGNYPYAWRVEITETGGPDNGPTLNIVNPAHGSLESPKLTVSGDRLRLSGEECAGASGYSFVETTYRWAVSGNTLRLTKLDGGCPDKIAETILTARPLAKVP
jgi:hypothetical protein